MIDRRGGGARTLAAFVLHQYDWSESSLIVELFSRERGRVAVVAKGAKRPTSSFRALLLPFQRLQVQLGRAPAEASSDIHALRAAEPVGWQGGLPRAGAALFAGFYINELLLRLLARDDPHAKLFDHYEAALPLLTSGDPSAVQATLRAFELVLLRELGWLPELHLVTQSLAPVQAQLGYDLHAELGVVPSSHADATKLSGEQLLALEAALMHGHFEPLHRAIHGNAHGAAARWRAPLRKLLDYHLNHATLRTRQVLQGVQTLVSR